MARGRRRQRRLPPTIRLPRAYRRHPLAAAAVVLLAVLVWMGRGQRVTPPAAAGGDYARYHDRVVRVTHVVDGDTIDVDVPDADKPTTRIRLWGVDTPEVAGSPRGEMYWGAQASEYAKQTLSNRRVRLGLVEGDTRDKYRRLLAYVFDADTGNMFNESLLRLGHAYADPRFTHPMREEFLALEREARSQRVGLWHGVTVEQMPQWRRRRER